MKTQSFKIRNIRASALIIVLWAVMVLSFATLIAADRAALILGDTSIRTKRFQADLLAETAIASLNTIFNEEQKKLAESGNDPDSKPLDLAHFQGIWSSDHMDLEGGTYWIEIDDEQSKIHWSKTPEYIWRNLLEDAGLATETVDAWFDALKDWQDPDDASSLNGAESSDYRGLDVDPRSSKNAPLTEMGEIPWIMGGDKLLDLNVIVDSEGKELPLKLFTTLYGDGKINLNTAPAVLIAAALNISMEDAEQMIHIRLGTDEMGGTKDDQFLAGVPSSIPLNTSGKQKTPVTQEMVSSGTTTTTALFRLRGIGEFSGQRVVREALATKGKGLGLQLLEDSRVIEIKSLPRTSS